MDNRQKPSKATCGATVTGITTKAEPLLFSSFPITSSGSPDVEATVDLSSP
uniref:Uncharacterized protein n=1 Tax=Vitis vinifera TaxID=29760 RepID=F6GZV5_VITVI